MPLRGMNTPSPIVQISPAMSIADFLIRRRCRESSAHASSGEEINGLLDGNRFGVDAAAMTSPVAMIREHGLVALIDVPVSGPKVLEWAMAVSKGGIKLLGVPVFVENVMEVVSDLTDEADLVVGISHVLEPEQISVAVAAGAELVFSPIADPAIIEAAKTRGLTVVAGACTPTEVQLALRAGADLVSLHPLGHPGGEKIFDAMKHTFRDVPLLVSGGIDVENAPAFLEAGAAAAIVDRGVFPESTESAATEIITMRAAALVEVCSEVLGTPGRISFTELRESQLPPKTAEEVEVALGEFESFID